MITLTDQCQNERPLLLVLLTDYHLHDHDDYHLLFSDPDSVISDYYHYNFSH